MVGHFQAGDMNDDRIVGWASLDFEDMGHRLRIQRVRSESIDGFRGQSDDAALSKQLRGLRHSDPE